MDTMTLITVAVVVFGVVNAKGYGRALALAGATPIAAAVVVGGVAVPTFYAVAIGAGIGLVLRLLVRSRSGLPRDGGPPPGLTPLGLLLAWAVFITLMAPVLFDGLSVLGTGAGGQLTGGVLSESNVAQIVYLFLSVCVVAFLAGARWAGVEIVGTAAGLATLLSFWSYLHATFGLPYPEGVFDNSPTFVFIETEVGGAPRVRGIFSEPAGLAASSLVTIAYMTSRAARVTGWRRAGAVCVAGIAAYLGWVSTSATFVVAGVALAATAVLVGLVRLVRGRRRLSLVHVVLGCLASVAALWLLPLLTGVVEDVISEKVGTSSYESRSSADARSFDLVLETYGLGVGLGANRPSSFLAGLLSTIGLVGAALLAVAVWTIVRRAFVIEHVRPAVWALVALLLSKAVSGPDLADPSGILWISLGVLSHHAMNLRRGTVPGALGTPTPLFMTGVLERPRELAAPTPPAAHKRPTPVERRGEPPRDPED
jgi:hypothetical protein